MSSQILAGAFLVAVLSAGAVGTWFGYQWADGACAAEKLRQATEQARYEVKWRDRHYELSAAFEALKAEKDKRKAEVRREIERIVERPVFLRDCMDADGLRILNAARGVPAASGESGAGVPGSGPGDGRDGRGAAAADGQ